MPSALDECTQIKNDHPMKHPYHKHALLSLSLLEENMYALNCLNLHENAFLKISWHRSAIRFITQCMLKYMYPMVLPSLAVQNTKYDFKN